MTEKQYSLVYHADKGGAFIKNNETGTEWYHDSRASLLEIVNELNGLAEENEQLKKDRFICLDCEHSGYVEIGCLCEKKDHWTDYMTECEDYEELK